MAATAAAPAVDGAVAGDREHPGPEGALVAGEAVEAVDDPQPGLGGQVLARPGGQGVQVAEQAGLQVAPEDAEGSLVAGGGGASTAVKEGPIRAITLTGPARYLSTGPPSARSVQLVRSG